MLTCKRVETQSDHHAVYHLRYKIYCVEKKWLNADRYPGMLESDERDPTATHFMALYNGELVGSLRLITRGPLPVQEHPSLVRQINTNGSAEVSRLVFLKDHRKFRNVLPLYLEAFRYSKQQNIRHWYIVAEPAFIRAMGIMGFGISPLGKATNYFGGPTLPAVIDLEKARQRLVTKKSVWGHWFHA